MINLSPNTENLFYYSYTPGVGSTKDTLCVPNSTSCSDWALTATDEYKEKWEVLNGSTPGFMIGSYHIIPYNAAWSDLQARDGYFFIVKINSVEDYNSILVKSDLNNIILPTDDSIKYPFYIIESARRPGYLLNVKSKSQRTITVEPANGQGTEKFSVTTFPTQGCV